MFSFLVNFVIINLKYLKMSFEEACVLKDKFGRNYPIDEKYMGIVMIVPYSDKELERYISKLKLGEFDDNTAKLFSTDSQFQVCALWSNGMDVLKKSLS
jgi:hypothetical protein